MIKNQNVKNAMERFPITRFVTVKIVFFLSIIINYFNSVILVA